MREIEQELNEVLFKVGVTDLLSTEKFVSKIKQHFERAGNLGILKEYVDKVSKRPDYQLMEEFVICKWNGDNVKLPFYEILEQEGITFGPDNFLKLNGERVAYVNDQIIPIKGKRKDLKHVLSEVIEVRRELSYPEEIYKLPSSVDPENGSFDIEKMRWIYPDDFVQANKAAYDFGLFWKNINEQKNSEDPFFQALRDIDSLPEFDPEEELRQIQFAKEFNKDQIKLKLLEELKRTKVYKDKKWRVIPITKLEMNPGYEEFFYNHLGDYSVEEIDNALKELEKELAGSNKLKVRTLRKEFEKKEGISRKKKLSILLGGLMAGAAGCYIAYELTRDRKPPVVKDLRWEPTRIVNDKVYDGKVSFVAEDEEPVINIFGLSFPLYKAQISNATLEFIPKIYSHLPKEAFPNETKRTYNLIPVDGKFDERVEEFLVNITDIKGGREYDIKVIAQDQAGNIGTANLTTPYIREFENLGKKLYERGITVSATYYPLYPDPHPWEWLEPMVVHPLLEKYDVRDLIVIAKHIDQATGHGINTFVFSWGIFGSNEEANKRIHENILNFLSHPFSNQIYFYLLYELPHRLSAGNVTADEYGYYNLSDSSKWKVVVEDFKLFNKDFFQKENYVKIQNKPVVYLYWSKSLRGNITTFLEDIRKTSENSIFLIGDHAEPGSATWIKEGHPFIEEYVKHFDGWSTWAAGWPNPHIEEPFKEKFPKFLEKGYSVWGELATKYNRTFITSIIPGFVNLRDPTFPRLPRDLDMFNEELKVALRYATPINGRRVIRIDTFNEFGEATGIEPTKEEGFSYLETILKFFFP